HTIADLRKETGLAKINEAIKDSKTVAVRQDLKNTLSMLMNQEAEQFIVVGENNENLGALTIDRVQQYLHDEIKGKETVSEKG
ncbi:MAG TPA: ABC transporter ATP-binding protein, partial [Bacillales bacterium]